MPRIAKTGIHKILSPSLVQSFNRFVQYVKNHCKERSASYGKAAFADVFTAIQRANDPQTGRPLWTKAELESETALLILAGSDNTASAIAATLFYLAHNSEAYAHCQAEVSQVFSSAKEIRTGQKLSSCSYLRACIEEALRLSPPAPGLMPREVLSGGLSVEGKWIPPGVEVGTPIYATQHDSTIYPEPFSFRPQRWLAREPSSHEGADKADLSQVRSAFCAFSRGSRDCVGKQMAYHEMMMILGHLLWRFEFRLGPGSTAGEGSPGTGYGRERRDEYQLVDFFAAAGSGPELCFKERRH